MRVGEQQIERAELNYTIAEKETYAVVYALIRWRLSCQSLTRGWR